MPCRPDRPLIVIPALDEQETIANVIKAIQTEHAGVAVLVVDDGSIDRTAAIATREGALVAPHAVNLGVGGAMRTGFIYALRNGYDAVIQVDGDGQHDPSQIDALLSGLETADIVIGTRFGPSNDYAIGFVRRLAIRLLSWAVSIHCRIRLTDVTSGFRAAGPRAIRLFARYYPVEYLADTVESLVIASQVGLIVKEVPVQMHPRQGGAASQSVVSTMMHLMRSLFVTVQSLIRGVPAGARDLAGVDK